MADIWDVLLRPFPGIHQEVLRRTPPRNAGGEGPAANRFSDSQRPNVKQEQADQTLRVLKYQAEHGATARIRRNARAKLAALPKTE